MSGYTIDGKTLVPATAYLTMVWEIIGTLHAGIYTEISVVFEDVNFFRAIHIPKEGEIQLTVMVQKGNFNVSIHTKYILSAIVINNIIAIISICFNLHIIQLHLTNL